MKIKEIAVVIAGVAALVAGVYMKGQEAPAPDCFNDNAKLVRLIKNGADYEKKIASRALNRVEELHEVYKALDKAESNHEARELGRRAAELERELKGYGLYQNEINHDFKLMGECEKAN